MREMTIGKKIALTCALLVVLTATLGLTSVVNLGRINSSIQLIVVDSLPGLYTVGKLSSTAKDIRGKMLIHIASDSQEDVRRVEGEIAELEKQVQEVMKSYEKTITTDRDRELFERLAPAYGGFLASWDKVLPLSRAMKNNETLALFRTEALPAFQKFDQAIEELVAFNKTNGDKNAEAATSAGNTALFWAWTILAVAVVSGSSLAFFIIRSTNSVLRHTAAEMMDGAAQVAAVSGQVSASGQSLSQGATEQAASLEETSASMEEMAAMTRKNSENCNSAAAMMADMSRQVEHSNNSLREMVRSMEAIKGSSEKVARIIKSIDEIAFQTNILALNAAVEAARAGEAGMSFAVVADEVRSLAQRSAQAAKDTAGLIEESISKANDGNAKLEQVSAAIAGITENATKVKIVVDEISEAARQQKQGIGQVTQAVSQMEKVTQSTAANAEESAAASEEMTSQAESLRGLVQVLQHMVGGNGGRQTVEPAAPRIKVAKSSKLNSMAPVTAKAKKELQLSTAELAIPLESAGD